MEKIELKCSSCGGNLHKVETLEDTYVCLHCGSREIIKQEAAPITNNITNNITTNVYNNADIKKEEYEGLIKAAESFIENEEYVKAVSLLERAKKITSVEYRAWWLSVKAKMLYNINNRFSKKRYVFEKIFEEYKMAYTFANDKERIILEKSYKNICLTCSKVYGETIEFLEPTFGKEKNLSSKLWLLIIAFVLSIVLLIIIFFINTTVFEMATNQNIEALLSLLFLCLYGLTIYLPFLLFKVFKECKLIEIIKQNEKISVIDKDLIEIYNNKQELIKVVTKLINKGYLTGYAIEKSVIVKIKKEQD